MSDRRLRRRLVVPSGWPSAVVVALLVGLGGRSLLIHLGSPAVADRWLVVALPVLVYQVGFLAYQQVDLGLAGDVSFALRLPTLVTMVRGNLYAVTSGFVLVTPETPLIAWIPGVCYGLGAALDYVDGQLARHLGGPTELGARLDHAFDTLGFLVAPLVGVIWGRLPAVYLSISAARYLFRAGIWWRRRRDLPVAPLPPSRYRRLLAGLQMAFITVALLPVVPPDLVHPVAIVVMSPSLAIFGRDYLHVTGRIAGEDEE